MKPRMTRVARIEEKLGQSEARVDRITFVEEKEFRKIKSFGLIRVIRGQISFPLLLVSIGVYSWCDASFHLRKHSARH
jgi:hypothetical protein